MVRVGRQSGNECGSGTPLLPNRAVSFDGAHHQIQNIYLADRDFGIACAQGGRHDVEAARAAVLVLGVDLWIILLRIFEKETVIVVGHFHVVELFRAIETG